MNIRAVTVIWGAEFVDMFLRVGLRSLLAEGNLPALAKAHRLIYTIYTTPEDASTIRAAPAFTRLHESVDVRFSLFSTLDIESSNFGSHNLLWKRGVELAQRNREILFFLIPDGLYAESTLISWASRFDKGYRAVYSPGPQVALETILPEIESRFPQRNDPIRLNKSILHNLLFRHMHPLHAAMLRDSPRRVGHPEYDIRPVSGCGFVMREWTSQPFCFDPNYFLGLTNFSPDDHLSTIAIEPCTILSVEPLFKHHKWYYRPWKLDDLRLSRLGGWFNYYSPPGCLRYSEFAHEFFLNSDSKCDDGRKQAITAGRVLRSQLIAAKQIFRIIEKLKQLGLTQSAALIATALLVARLRKRVLLHPGATLLVPTNAAYETTEKAGILHLLELGKEQHFIDRIRDHILPVTRVGDSPQYKHTALGLPLEPLVNGVTVTFGPVIVDGFTIYAIDRVLNRDATKASPSLSKSEGASIPEDLRSETCSFKSSRVVWFMHPFLGTWGLSDWAMRSSANRVLYFALHIPLMECFASLFFTNHVLTELRAGARWIYSNLSLSVTGSPHTFRADLHKVMGIYRGAFRHYLHRTYFVAEHTPGLGRIARLLRRAYIIMCTEGVRATARLVLTRFFGTYRIAAASRRANRAAHLISRGLHEIRSQGLRAAWRKTATWVYHRIRSSTLQPSAAASLVSDEALTALREVRIVRTLLAMEEILEHYVRAVMPPNVLLAPLKLVRDRLMVNGLAGNAADLSVENTLKTLIKQYPNWAECWLELGLLKLDRGKSDEALTCFTNATEGKRLSDYSTECDDPRAVAFAEQARLLLKQGRPEEAAQAYAASLSKGMKRCTISVEYANVLRQLGRLEETLDLFAEGIYHDESSWCVPQVSRDSSEITFSALAINDAGKG